MISRQKIYKKKINNKKMKITSLRSFMYQIMIFVNEKKILFINLLENQKKKRREVRKNKNENKCWDL